MRLELERVDVDDEVALLPEPEGILSLQRIVVAVEATAVAIERGAA